MEGFTAKDVKRLAGISYRQLNDWESKRVFNTHRPEGRGWRRFSRNDLVAMLVVKQLRQTCGLPVDRLRRLFKAFGNEPGNISTLLDLLALRASIVLITDLDATIVVSGASDVVGTVQPFIREHRSCLLLDLAPIAERIRQIMMTNKQS
ncbi:MAG: MerR family transcriptional regulator [Terriglobales bacterium]